MEKIDPLKIIRFLWHTTYVIMLLDGKNWPPK